jgi:hypothetical protein
MKDSSESVFLTSGRSAYGVFVPVFVVGMALAWGSSFDGPAHRISPDYWRLVVPVAIPLAVFVAWRLHKALFGAWYTPRYAKDERQMGLAESWQMGAIAAVILVGLAVAAFSNVMNQVIGIPYVATYDVAAKFVEPGYRNRRTCYGLSIVRVGDSQDQFQLCVSKSEQERTAIGARLQVRGRQSRYVNQILSFASDTAA